MMRLLPDALLFVALKLALRESLRSRSPLAVVLAGFAGNGARYPAAFRLSKTGANV
jgi:hypothetical protein